MRLVFGIVGTKDVKKTCTHGYLRIKPAMSRKWIL